MSRPSMGGTRANILVHGGTAVVGGTQVQGDQITDSGQQGDNVEIKRGEAWRISLNDESVEIEYLNDIDRPDCRL